MINSLLLAAALTGGPSVLPDATLLTQPVNIERQARAMRLLQEGPVKLECTGCDPMMIAGPLGFPIDLYDGMGNFVGSMLFTEVVSVGGLCIYDDKGTDNEADDTCDAPETGGCYLDLNGGLWQSGVDFEIQGVDVGAAPAADVTDIDLRLTSECSGGAHTVVFTVHWTRAVWPYDDGESVFQLTMICTECKFR